MELNRPVFAVRGRIIRRNEVVDAAFFRGDLDFPWRTLLSRIAEGEKGAVANHSEIQDAADQFRTDRDLITAEETEQWMAARSLSSADFGDFFVRQSLTPSLSTGPTEPAYPDAPPEWRHFLHVDLIMSGAFEHFALRLARRFAALAESGGEVESADFATLEETYRACRSQVLSGEACRRTMVERRLSLMSFTCEVMEIEGTESEDVVKEILFCLRDDELSMAEVSLEAGYPMKIESWELASLPEGLARELLGADPGEVVGPMVLGEVLAVVRLLEKQEPSLEDAAVRRRVEHEIGDAYFSRLASSHIQWVFPMADLHDTYA